MLSDPVEDLLERYFKDKSSDVAFAFVHNIDAKYEFFKFLFYVPHKQKSFDLIQIVYYFFVLQHQIKNK